MAKENTMKERGILPNEGDVVREFQAMQEEDFWSRWLREDEKSKEEREVEAEKKRRSIRRKEEKREGERRWTVKRR